MESLYPIALKKVISSFFKDLKISDFKLHKESKEYSACSFLLNKKSVEFRLSKITPKKDGAFVTIWKRNEKGITQPFEESNQLDFIIVACENGNDFGVFIFPKLVLVDKKIISLNGIGGKRGIRVYPAWAVGDNPQSKKTQMWQVHYFVQLTENKFSAQNLIAEYFK